VEAASLLLSVRGGMKAADGGLGPTTLAGVEAVTGDLTLVPRPVRDFREPRKWQRLVLYALTDALAHNHLLVGTLAAHLQRQNLDADLLRRYLQSPDPDRYITGEAVQHLDGLTGAVPEEAVEPVRTAVGRRIARDSG